MKLIDKELITKVEAKLKDTQSIFKLLRRSATSEKRWADGYTLNVKLKYKTLTRTLTSTNKNYNDAVNELLKNV